VILRSFDLFYLIPQDLLFNNLIGSFDLFPVLFTLTFQFLNPSHQMIILSFLNRRSIIRHLVKI